MLWYHIAFPEASWELYNEDLQTFLGRQRKPGLELFLWLVLLCWAPAPEQDKLFPLKTCSRKSSPLARSTCLLARGFSLGGKAACEKKTSNSWSSSRSTPEAQEQMAPTFSTHSPESGHLTLLQRADKFFSTFTLVLFVQERVSLRGHSWPHSGSSSPSSAPQILGSKAWTTPPG